MTLRANALKGPFQGLGATLVRNTPANSIYLGSFEVLKDYIARWQGVKKADLPGSAFCLLLSLSTKPCTSRVPNVST